MKVKSLLLGRLEWLGRVLCSSSISSASPALMVAGDGRQLWEGWRLTQMNFCFWCSLNYRRSSQLILHRVDCSSHCEWERCPTAASAGAGRGAGRSSPLVLTSGLALALHWDSRGDELQAVSYWGFDSEELDEVWVSEVRGEVEGEKGIGGRGSTPESSVDSSGLPTFQ